MNARLRAVYALVAVLALAWLFPVIWALLNSFRSYAYTAQHGYVSFGGWTLKNYADAWERGNFAHYLLNSLYVTVPAVIASIGLAACVAFVIARFSFRFNVALLGLFTAANLLPPQALLIPVYRIFRQVPMPFWISSSGSLLNSFLGLILVNTAFQTGFCTFVLSNYMKTLPAEMFEAAEVDGAGVWTRFWRLALPLCRAPLAALAVLEVTWIYNEFFWATVLMQDSSKFPITSSLNNLRGAFFTDNNLVAAASVIVAMPTLIVFLVLQRQFVAGLTMGSTKG
ncbi:carbohydrate ABC transporter permease [Kineosporia succinea]|uniref:Multiple sugar transport system permease protein n=1 Tax=Kineosporia succinea TaxID=84632 RepID=A0ABT9PEQ8_9ACTN|nr:carbohydrate ABC transporter permease [Kineosporia succinea]MDP9831191.1 multiple sugar transport system permease protein [Kineosporia succinea]